jgi:hypothetical protein
MKQTLKKHLINVRGGRINKKIVFFESDDWGSIRIPNNKIKGELLKEGLVKDKDSFSKFDTLKSYDDYSALFEYLNDSRN